MKDLIERLESRAIPEPNSGCLIWLGAVTSEAQNGGYGSIRVTGRPIRAHRAMFEAVNGPIPDNLSVCHRCDVQLCINPNHLFLGTRGDNNRDRRRKSRDFWFQNPALAAIALAKARSRRTTPARGTANGLAKLTDSTVAEIRRLYSGGTPQTELARIYGIAQSTLSSLIARKTWKHVL